MRERNINVMCVRNIHTCDVALMCHVRVCERFLPTDMMGSYNDFSGETQEGCSTAPHNSSSHVLCADSSATIELTTLQEEVQTAVSDPFLFFPGRGTMEVEEGRRETQAARNHNLLFLKNAQVPRKRYNSKNYCCCWSVGNFNTVWGTCSLLDVLYQYFYWSKELEYFLHWSAPFISVKVQDFLKFPSLYEVSMRVKIPTITMIETTTLRQIKELSFSFVRPMFDDSQVLIDL